MICPTCGAEVAEAGQCPECGAALLPDEAAASRLDSQEDTAFKQGDSEGYWQMSFTVQPAEPVEPIEEVRPVTHDADIDELIFASVKSDSSSSSEEEQPAFEDASERAAVPNIAFALAVAGVGVGVVMAIYVLGIVFTTGGTYALAATVPALGILTAIDVIGLLLSAAGVVLNMRNSKPELENPRSGLINLLGAIGLIAGAFALAMLIMLNITARQALDAVNENGWNVEEVQVVQGPDGTIVVRERSEAASGNSAQGASPESSASATSSASSSVSSEPSSTSNSSASSASSSAAPSGSIYYDAQGNPTLHSLIELNGSDLQSLLKAGEFRWYDEITAWLKSNGAVFQAVNRNGNMSRGDIEKLSAGAAGASVAYVLSAEGYKTPQQALTGLAAGVTIDERHESEGAEFAVVHGLSGDKYLVLITSTGDNEQTVLVYGETAIKEGLFRDTIGIDVGSSVTDAWGIVAG